MRQLIQGSVKVAVKAERNAKFLVIDGRKAEEKWFPASMSPEDVKRVLVERQEIPHDARVIRG